MVGGLSSPTNTCWKGRGNLTATGVDLGDIRSITFGSLDSSNTLLITPPASPERGAVR